MITKDRICRGPSNSVQIFILVCKWPLSMLITITVFFPEIMSIFPNQFFWYQLTHYQMTNFRLFQTERVCRRQFKIWRRWHKVIQTGRKHWEKEKLLVMSNFSFSHSVFKRLVSQGRQKVSLCGNGLMNCDTSCVSILVCKWSLSMLITFTLFFPEIMSIFPNQFFWYQLMNCATSCVSVANRHLVWYWIGRAQNCHMQ